MHAPRRFPAWLLLAGVLFAPAVLAAAEPQPEARPVPAASAVAAAPLRRNETLAGSPLLRRFMPEDYKAAPQHLAIASDAQGRLLVGNIEGVLRYDGETWQLIELPNKSSARSMAVGADGRLYVGSYDSFGWMEPTPEGGLRYQELLTKAGLAGRDRHVGIVWEVLTNEDGIYFRTEHALHFLDYEHTGAKRWPLPEEVRSFTADGKTLYVRVQGRGFSRFEDGRFILEPGGELFADQPLPAVLPRAGWRLLVGDRGLYRADNHGIAPLSSGDGAVLDGSDPYTAQALGDGSLVVGTRNGELLRFGQDFKLRQRVDLGNYAVEALGVDREGGLWAATEGGLYRLSVPSAWSFLGAAHGLRGNTYDFEWFDGALWLASSRGISRLGLRQDGQFRAVRKPWTDWEAYELTLTRSGLLIGHRDGAFLLRPGADQPEPLIKDEAGGVYTLEPSRHDPNLVFGISSQSIFILRQDANGWREQQRIDVEGLSLAGVEELGPGELWLGDSRGGPQRWRIDLATGKRVSREVFGEKQGLELDPNVGSTLFVLDGRLHVISGDRGFRLDGERFVADVSPPFTLVDRPRELVVDETALGVYAFTSRQLWHRAPGDKEWKPIYLSPDLAAGYGRLRVNQDGVLRISTWSGLLQFDRSEQAATLPPLQLTMESVLARAVGDPTRPPLVLPTRGDRSPVQVPPGHSLNVRFSLVSMESGSQFRYFLHGVTPEWSDWTDRDLFIRALSAGDYVLEVQARTRSGRAVPGLSYRFRVMPRWFEQWWAWGLGLVLLAGLGGLATYVVVRRRTERYLAANRRLESRIAERTRELETANRMLAELATEDALTGVANRRALEQGLRREWYRCLDQRRPLAALMVDVDHFKKFNDTHGHLEGDVQLKNVAQQLNQLHDPQRELLARYGGEEFALLLPGVHLDEARRRGELLRAAVAEGNAGMTVSIGVAGFVPDVQSEPDSLLRRADAALYRAKRGGRNRVEADTD